MLLERLGPRLAELGLSNDKQIESICSSLLTAWAPLPHGELRKRLRLVLGYAEPELKVRCAVPDLVRVELVGFCVHVLAV